MGGTEGMNSSVAHAFGYTMKKKNTMSPWVENNERRRDRAACLYDI